jgi:hypothetical protein
MKTFFLITLWIPLLSVSFVRADNMPAVYLKEGSNFINFNLSNNLLVDLNNVNIKIAENSAPKWLNINLPDENLSITRGKKEESKISLDFTVKNAPSDAEAIIPIIIEDDTGNRWNFSIKVYTDPSLPLSNSLEANYPNPFNPSTTIKFSLNKNVYTKLTIYNTLGQKVKTLLNSSKSPGVYEVQWNGVNDNGQMVSSGVYFYKLEAGDFIKTKRMLLLE